MKKRILILSLVLVISLYTQAITDAAEKNDNQNKNAVILEVPSDNLEEIDIKYKKEEKIKSVNDIKQEKPAAGNKSIITLKETKNATKSFAIKTAETAKSAANTTVKATKKGYKKAAGETKDFIDNAKPDKTEKDYESLNKRKSLKGERKAINSAYNSRIKDKNARIKSVESSEKLSEEQRDEVLNKLNKEKAEMKKEKQEYLDKYDNSLDKERAAK